MRHSLTLIVLSACSLAVCLPSTNHVLHERTTGIVNGRYRRGERVLPDAIVPLRIGLTQQNLETGYDLLMDVSHPESSKYGQHLTAEEVHDIFKPSIQAVEEVRAWLVDSGINDDGIVHSDNKGWLAADISAAQFERLFKAELFEHEHTEKDQLRIGCSEYHVPQHIQHHVDYITPGVKLSSPMKKKKAVKRSNDPWSPPPRYGGPRSAPPGWEPPHSPSGPWSPPGNLPPEIADCGRNITPACYRALYGIPIPTTASPENTVGLYEDGDHYAKADLDLWFAKYQPRVPQGTYPIPAYIDGAVGPVPQGSTLETGESIIDIDIITSLTYPQTITLYQTDDLPQATLEGEGKLEGYLNTFLDALDGSYCTSTAFGITGDSPGIDATYPDPLPGGYKGQLQCGVYKPARVISASYGESESDLPINYQRRQCQEFMKLGLQGHSIFFSSSDYGVGAPPGDPSPSGCLSGYGQNQTIYAPDNPANCPYITGVGATQLNANETVYDPETALQQNLGPGALSLFASHGGFANYFPTPSYQTKAVSEYFAQHDPGHPYYTANSEGTNVGENGGIYNRGGRGIPDVSSNGANLRAIVNGTDGYWFGTSLAAPTWASIITLINEERTAAGKGPVGFVNPVLYANTWVFNDITNGSNPNCGSSGFTAVEGWDPITGLGTPKYPKLLELFMGLP